MNDQTLPISRITPAAPVVDAELSASGVSWGAIIGGAFVAASAALILTVLGVGLGLSSISPWTNAGASAAAIGASAIVWLIVTQAIASGLGGYLAGRLRIKWASVHDDEVYFRDTAHGFIVWAVGVVITVGLLASALTSAVSTGVKAAAAGATAVAATGAATAAGARGENPADGAASASTATSSQYSPRDAQTRYLTDSLFRADHATTPIAPQTRAEIGGVIAEGVRTGAISPADRTYAAQVIAAQTGISQADAEARVDTIYAKAKSVAADAEAKAKVAADDARSAAAKASLWFFVALLTGAFCASLAATFGGRQRDRVLSR